MRDIEADLTPGPSYSRIHSVQLPSGSSGSASSVELSALSHLRRFPPSVGPSHPPVKASSSKVSTPQAVISPEETADYTLAPRKLGIHRIARTSVSSPAVSRRSVLSSPSTSSQSAVSSPAASYHSAVDSESSIFGDSFQFNPFARIPAADTQSIGADSDSDSDTDESADMSRTVQLYRGSAGPLYSTFKNEVRCALAEKMSKKVMRIDVIFQLIEGWCQPESQAFCYVKEIQDALFDDYIVPVLAGLPPLTIVPVLASDPDVNRMDETLDTSEYKVMTNEKTGVTVIANRLTRRLVTDVDLVLAIFWQLMDRRFAAATSQHIHEFMTSRQCQSDPKETAGAFAARLAAQLTGMGGKVTEVQALHVWFSRQKDITLSATVERQMEDLPDGKRTLLTAERLADAVEARRDEKRVIDHQIAASSAALQPPRDTRSAPATAKSKATFPANLPAAIIDEKSPDAPCSIPGHRGHRNKDCRQQHPELGGGRNAFDPKQFAEHIAKAFMSASGTSSVNVTAMPRPSAPAPVPVPAVSNPTAPGYVAKQQAKIKPAGGVPKSVNPQNEHGRAMCATCGLHPAHLPCYILDPRSAPVGWAPVDTCDAALIAMWRAARKKQGLPEPAPKLRRVPHRFRDEQPSVHFTATASCLPEPITDYDEDGIVMTGMCHAGSTPAVHVIPASFIPRPIHDPPGTLPHTASRTISPTAVESPVSHPTATDTRVLQLLQSLVERMDRLEVESAANSCHHRGIQPLSVPLLQSGHADVTMEQEWVQAYMTESVDIPYAVNSTAADGLSIQAQNGRVLLSQHVLIDTGSNQCIISESACSKLGLTIYPSNVAPVGFGGEASPVLGCTEPLSITLKAGTVDALTTRCSFLVVRAKQSLYDVLIGIKQLHALGAMPDPLTKRLYFRPMLLAGRISNLASIPLRMTPIDLQPTISVCKSVGLAVIMMAVDAGIASTSSFGAVGDDSDQGSNPPSSTSTAGTADSPVCQLASSELGHLSSIPLSPTTSLVNSESAGSFSCGDGGSIPTSPRSNNLSNADDALSWADSDESAPPVLLDGEDDPDLEHSGSSFTIPWEAGDDAMLDLSPAGTDLMFALLPPSPSTSSMGSVSDVSTVLEFGGVLPADVVLAPVEGPVSNPAAPKCVSTTELDAILVQANLQDLFSTQRHRRHFTSIPPNPSHCPMGALLLVLVMALVMLMAGQLW